MVSYRSYLFINCSEPKIFFMKRLFLILLFFAICLFGGVRPRSTGVVNSGNIIVSSRVNGCFMPPLTAASAPLDDIDLVIPGLGVKKTGKNYNFLQNYEPLSLDYLDNIFFSKLRVFTYYSDLPPPAIS